MRHSRRPSVDSRTLPSKVGNDRLVFVDALRVAVIVMVIVHHAGQAYGPDRSWLVVDPATSVLFRPFFTVNAAFGLGLMFLLAGYFVPRAYDRKGAGRFLRERWARIGVPLVVVGLGVQLPLVLVFGSQPTAGDLVRSLYEDGWAPIYGHLWFLGHLLVYSALYVAWRRSTDQAGRSPRSWPAPGHAAIAGFAILLALTTWIVRIWYPVDEWVPLFFVLSAEPANLPQYVSLFVLGIVAYRGDWFRRLPTRAGLTWLGVGLLAATAVFAMEAFGVRNDLTARGGLDGRSLLRASLEAVIGAGLTVGLIVVFRELFRRPRPSLTALAAASYAAYVVHPYIVVGLQGAFVDVSTPVFGKFALVAVVGTVLSFGVAHISQWVPGIRVILGTGLGPSGVPSASTAGSTQRPPGPSSAPRQKTS